MNAARLTHGLGHLTLAGGILLGVGLFSSFPDQFFTAVTDHKPLPRTVVLNGSREAACLAQTVETVAGLMGCASAGRAVQFQRADLVR